MKQVNEKRRSLRQKTFLIGRVVQVDAQGFDVVVVDMSAGGARLFVDEANNLARNFDLRIKRRKTVYKCELIHRTGETAGIRFLSSAPASSS